LRGTKKAMVFYRNAYSRGGNIIEDVPAFSLSKKSGWSWAFSDRYGRMGKGDARCWNAGKWIEIW